MKYGQLLFKETGTKLPLQVLKSAAGYYIGTFGEDGPETRESEEYYKRHQLALTALENNTFTQRLYL